VLAHGQHSHYRAYVYSCVHQKISIWLRKNFFLFLILIFFQQVCVGQSSQFFTVEGTNVSSVNCGEIIFVPHTNVDWESNDAGSVWLQKRIDLEKPFTLNFVVDFVDLLGVDGATFAITEDSAAIGEPFNGLGYNGIKNSLAVVFDRIQNDKFHDPPFPYVGIQSNGDLDHNGVNNLAGPVSIQSLYRNVVGENWFDHRVTITWDPSTKTFAVYIEGNLYLSIQNDIVQNFFHGNTKVFWGFTSSTTQLQYYPPNDIDIQLGYFRFSFGQVYPKYSSQPELDTCYDKPIQFSDNSRYVYDNVVSGLDLFKWYWSFGDGDTSTLQNPPAHVYPGPGVYWVKYTVTNQLGCAADTLKKLITLGSTPVVHISYNSLCLNTPIQFKDESFSPFGDPVTWSWNFGNGVTSNQQNPVFTFNTLTSTQVSLAVKTIYGCNAKATIPITITQKPVIDFSFAENCDGGVQYAANNINNNVVNVTKWVWSFGDNINSIEKDPYHIFKRNGTYQSSLYAVSDHGCYSDTIAKPVSIDKLMPFAGNDTIIAINQPLQLNGTGGTIYEWQPSTGLNNPFISNPVAILQSDQDYQLTVKNNEGCEGTASIKVKVYKGPDIYIPNAFTPNNDGLNDVFRIIAPGIKTILSFQVFDRKGQLMYESANREMQWDGTFKGEMQPAGTYVWYVKAVDYNGNNVFKRGTVVLIR